MKNDEKSMKKPEKYYLVKMRKKVCIFPGLFWPEKRLVHKWEKKSAYFPDYIDRPHPYVAIFQWRQKLKKKMENRHV